MNARHHAMRYRTPDNAIEGVCGVSIFQSNPDMAVVVLTEIEGNPGMSVTNAIEYIATKAKKVFLPNVTPDQVLWVERYENSGSTLDGAHETFDLVALKVGRNSYHSPAWRPIGNRDAASFWKLLFQSDKPLGVFPDFAKAGEAMR